MKQSRRFLLSFEQDLNLLETPPHRSITNNYEIIIKTKDYLEQKIQQTFHKTSVYTNTQQTTAQLEKFNLDSQEQRNQRARTIDQMPCDFRIDSQLRVKNQKKIQVKENNQTKQNNAESSCSYSSIRRESSSQQQKSILKKQSIKDSNHSSQRHSISSHSGKSVRFRLNGSTDMKKFMNFGK